MPSRYTLSLAKFNFLAYNHIINHDQIHEASSLKQRFFISKALDISQEIPKTLKTRSNVLYESGFCGRAVFTILQKRNMMKTVLPENQKSMERGFSINRMLRRDDGAGIEAENAGTVCKCGNEN